MFGVTVGGDIPKFHELLKQTAEYVYGASQWEGVLPYPGAREFFDAYTKEFGHEPSYHSAAGYGGCMLYAQAVRTGAAGRDRILVLTFSTGAAGEIARPTSSRRQRTHRPSGPQARSCRSQRTGSL